MTRAFLVACLVVFSCWQISLAGGGKSTESVTEFFAKVPVRVSAPFPNYSSLRWSAIPVACGTNPATAIFDGKNATFRCSTTTTLAAGASASVVNTGTSSDGVLKFSIPRGNTGATGKDGLYCNISTMVRTISYDSYGVNPQPSLTAMALQMWHGAVKIVADTLVWWTGGASQRIYGSATTALFTPSVKPVFSHISSNNFVGVMGRYSSLTTGIQWCSTGIPLPATRAGAKGDDGAAGSPDDQAAILGKIDDPTTGAILSMQQGNGEATTAAKIRVQAYSPAITLWYVDAGGAAYFKDSNGYDRIKISPAGTISVRDTSNVLRLDINTSGEIVGYKSNGAFAFGLYSSRWVR